MPFGTPTAILTGVTVTGGPPRTTTGTSATVTAGTSIFISFAPYDTAGVPFVTSVVDSVGNVYSQVVGTAAYAIPGPGFSSTSLWACLNAPNTLPIGGTFTINGTWNGTNGIAIGTAFYVTSPSGGLDVSNSSTNTGLVTSLSLGPSGPLVSSSDVVIAVAGSSSNFGTWTDGAGFTTLSNAGANVTSYELVGSAAPITWAPSWVNSVPFGAVLASFKPLAGPAPLTTGFAWSEC